MAKSFQRFEAMDCVEDIKLSRKEQKELIEKLQDSGISSHEKNLLIKSFYNLVIKIARGFEKQFPDRTLEDLVEDGIYHLWLRFPSYDRARGCPSTFVTLVVKTAYLKELSKLRNRTVKQEIIEEDTGESQTISIPNLSLNSFMDESGDEYEPDILGCEDERRLNLEDKICFEEMMIDMFQSVCKTIKDFRILNTMLDVAKLPNYGGGRRRKCLNKIAEDNDVRFSDVENVAKRVRPYLRHHDFLTYLTKNHYRSPSISSVFGDEYIEETFLEGDDSLDVWDFIE